MKPALPLTLLAALPLAALSGCGRAGAEPRAAQTQAPAPIPVRTEPVARGAVSRPIRTSGLVAAPAVYGLSFHAGGRLASIAVTEGHRVRKGQVLAALDATAARAAAAQAREARDKARRDADRARALRQEDAVPVVIAQDAATGEAVADAALQAAEWNLAHAVLVAPEDGFVDQRLAEPGEVVGPGQPVLHVSGVGGGWIVRAAVTERDVLGLAPGQPAEVSLEASGASFPGRVKEIAHAASRGTGTFDVEIALDPRRAPADLRSGLTARVAIARQVPVAGSVPLAAVQEGAGDQGVVYAVDAGRARRVPVRIAFLTGDRVAVAAGLEGLQEVVVDGAARLFDGAAVVLSTVR